MTELPEEFSEEVLRIGKTLASKRKPAPTVKYTPNDEGTYSMCIGKENSTEEAARIMEALGLFGPNMLGGLLSWVSNSVAKSKGKIDQSNTDFAPGLVKSIEPQNEVEAVLAAQMAATHVCMLDSSRRFLRAESLAARDSAERAMNWFGRTFAAQMETLKRYRQTAQQTVRVERVTVNERGEAIVGNVERGGGHGEKNGR